LPPQFALQHLFRLSSIVCKVEHELHLFVLFPSVSCIKPLSYPGCLELPWMIGSSRNLNQDCQVADIVHIGILLNSQFVAIKLIIVNSKWNGIVEVL